MSITSSKTNSPKRQLKLKKLFINNLESWFANFIIETFRTDHIVEARIKYEIMCSNNNNNQNEHIPLYFEPKIISFDFNAAFNNEIFQNDIIIYNLNNGSLKEAEYIIKGLNTLKIDNEKIVIFISNIFTWANTKTKYFDENNNNENNNNENNNNENNENNEYDFYYKPIDDDEIREKKRKEKEEKERLEKERLAQIELEAQNNKKNNNKKEQKEQEQQQQKNETEEQEQNENKNEEEEENIENMKGEKTNILYFTEKDYMKRVPSNKYKKYIYIENLALKLNKNPKIKSYIICPGLIYGYGEPYFYPLFKNAILNIPLNRIILQKENNVIPTIHMKDIINIIKKIVEKKPESKYIIAVDDCKNKTLKDLLKNIYTCVGNREKTFEEEEKKEEIEENEEKENEEIEDEKKDEKKR